MGQTIRRTLLLSILALATVFLARPHSQFSPLLPAQAIGIETFTQVVPRTVYEQLDSHFGLADADPAAGGLNGYCVEVVNEGNTAIANGNDGFSVSNGLIVDSDAFTNLTGTTVDDVYCVVVRSAAAVTAMTVTWTFGDGADVFAINLNLAVFVVTLEGTNGAIGLPGTVCTVGWDAQYLTGLASVTPAPAPIPNPLDKVAAADWTPAAGSVLGVSFRIGDEWCISIESAGIEPPFDVTLDFVLVRALGTNVDNEAITVIGTDVIEILPEPEFSELRHVSAEGQLLDTQSAFPSVPGSLHSACILPSAPGDTLSAGDVNWGSAVTGSVVQVFNDADSGAPDFGGVSDGTLCFTWTSNTAGTQYISLDFHKETGPNAPETRHASWDTNGDGNGATPLTNTTLIKEWLGFDRTEITSGTNFDPDDPNDPLDTDNFITDETITVPLQFNIANGAWILGGGSAGYVEWVVGPGNRFLDGVLLEISITSTCGYFANESNDTISLGTTISGVSVNGRFDRTSQGDPFGDGPDDFHIGTSVERRCTPNQAVTVVIEAKLPGGASVDTETLTIEFSAAGGGAGNAIPILAWAGQTVPIPYAFTFSGTCADETNTVVFTRGDGPGSFLPASGFSANGSGSVSGIFTGCSALLFYESEDVGEVSIEVSVAGNDFSKVVYHIFYMAFEDVTITATPELFVSEVGDVSASVRGWFPGSNPSGRPELTTPDGRKLPQDRWVLPDDWIILRGDDVSFRPNWPAAAPMPLTNVTFFMENEGIVNNFAAGITHGGLGWMVEDGTESSFDVVPRTGVPSVLGTPLQPRILTDLTDGDGVATIDSFGDFNLGYAECDANGWKGSPQCSRDDFLGATTYYAIAEYPENLGKWPPIQSDTATTDWLWAGYKEVTVEAGESPNVKYIVAHLRDRDGFCDAIGYNNTLGIPIEFLIDGGEGVIIEGADDDVFISDGGGRAVVHTFDTQDNFGQPINTSIAKPGLNDDECQAWVKVANSTQVPTNVVVVFPSSPSPIPADVRISDLNCGAPESFTLTNNSAHSVWLAGFGVNSRQSDPFAPWEHYQLDGMLVAGESRTYVVTPDPLTFGFLNGGSTEVFSQSFADWANLMWNGFELSTWFCDGETLEPALPAALPFSGEGEILVDVLAAFNEEIKITFNEGWNFVTVPGDNFMEELLAQHGDQVIVIYRWDPDAMSWEKRFPELPLVFSNLQELVPGRAYWVQVKFSFTLSYQP